MPTKPWGSRQDYLTDLALQAMNADPEQIRQIRPQHPLALFPETRGMIRQEASVMDILNVDRYVASNRSWVSGLPVMREILRGEINGSPQYSMDALG